MAGRLEIYPGIGLGPIRIGMRPAEVLTVFSESQVYEEWMNGNLNDAMLYRGLRLHFDKCDSSAPLPDSLLNWIVIHQRTDAFLFDLPVNEWTKETVLQELLFRGYAAITEASGDVVIPGQLALSFEGGQLIWVEIYKLTMSH